MYNVIGIYDEDIMYRKKLAEFFINNSTVKFNIVSFSNLFQIKEYVTKNIITILIFSKELDEELYIMLNSASCNISNSKLVGYSLKEGEIEKDIFLKARDFDGDSINERGKPRNYSNGIKYGIKLLDENDGSKFSEIDEYLYGISRYSSSKDLLNAIEVILKRDSDITVSLELNDGVKSNFIDKSLSTRIKCTDSVLSDKRCKIIAIYSPIKRCGKTVFSILLTEFLSRYENTLYISLDSYSEKFSDDRNNLADLVYDMGVASSIRSNDTVEYKVDNYNDYIKKWKNISYIPSSLSTQDINDISPEHIENVINMFMKYSDFKWIVIDFTDDIKFLNVINKYCDYIFEPYIDDCISLSKLKVFDTYLPKIAGKELYDELISKIYKICLPLVNCTGTVDEFYKELEWSEFGEFVWNLFMKVFKKEL